MKLNSKLFAQMREATRKLFSKGGDPAAATSAIQQALAELQADQAKAKAQSQARAMHDINSPPGGTAKAAPESRAAETPPPRAPLTPQQMAQDFMARLGVPSGPGQRGFEMPNFDLGSFDLPGMKGAAASAPPELAPGAQFIGDTFRNHAGARDYKLYIPSGYKGQALPLLVMLHGCTQNPDDFAAGTQMNAVAEEKQCFVVYPAQAKSANNSRCWNWFNALDQQRGQGEPSLIAGIAQHIIDEYPVDQRQVYVAGLSAGGAMAVIVGTLYPELFAAVGVHSGLPFASAQDLPSALAAMKGGASPSRKAPGDGVPIIVFHGDRDTTVNPRNGAAVMEQGLRGQDGSQAAAVDKGSVPNGHRYTRTTHNHQDGSLLGEHWLIHGAGHAWSGGSDNGSYTDAKGPDASREMMRFFETVAA
ncbi:PHB depolymerase family esterase [Janthinobacterium sp.]|uniref:extracellular catalytic domain type 1 short-chain-length polyhydroxyalkanoate depolymerase n=1 Tax=Janthinobacterium sp. TaxID=1871054 RepID=UPI00293D3565|nr:PHB depolymerase family esterase [Janthinobacterium sp.]